MQFPTVTFVIFFGVVLVGAWTLASRPIARKCWLVAASGFFYAQWDARFVGLLAAMVVVTWGFARAIHAATAESVGRRLLVAGVTIDLLVLAVFKYYGFFVDSVSSAFGRFGVDVHPPLLRLALPLGVSFYTFQAISYLVDVRRRRIIPAGLLDVSTWLSFFATVTSGPITRATEFMPQLAVPPDAGRVDTAHAFWLICRGLTKKLVVASFLASAITDKTIATPAAYSSLTLLVGIYAYAAQIYCDFSGYTDMALGMSALLGFELPRNFDHPYTATSVQDFWARWHMTLSRWLRDYLFAPFMGGSGRRPARAYAGIVLVMLLAGLWHGAAWGFVVFGGVHGVAMAVERWRRNRRRRLRRPLPSRAPWRQLLRRVATFHIVCLGWVFFASPSVSSAATMLRDLATNWSSPVSLLTPLLLLAVAAVIGLQYLPDRWGERLLERVERWSPALQAAAMGAASVPILAMAPTTVPAFIYYRF